MDLPTVESPTAIAVAADLQCAAVWGPSGLWLIQLDRYFHEKSGIPWALLRERQRAMHATSFAFQGSAEHQDLSVYPEAFDLEDNYFRLLITEYFPPLIILMINSLA